MRKIKFRVWDKEKREWIRIGEERDIMLNNKGEVWEYHSGQEPYWTKPNVEIVFYTGLKDKNGKEIYDFDILKTNLGNIGIVGHSFSICWHIGYKTNRENHVMALWNETNRIEIIGNIYENAELLSETSSDQ